jgi:alpha-galactosidase
MAAALLRTAALALLALSASSIDNGLGRVPIRGVTSWCMQGECGWDRCWDAQYRSLADAMVSEGMKASGYLYLHVDDCWVGGRNATTGELYPDPQRFPHGMASLADYIHSKGLLFGIYTDVTLAPCIHGQYDSERGDVPGSVSSDTTHRAALFPVSVVLRHLVCLFRV